MGNTGEFQNDSIWKQRFRQILDLCTSLYWQEDKGSFYQIIAEHLRTMTAADCVNIRLLSSTQDSFVIYATSGNVNRELLRKYSVLSFSTGRMPKLMKSLEPIVFDFSNPQSEDIEWKSGTRDGFQMAISVPLVSADSVVGVFDLLYCEEQLCDKEYLEWLADLGRLAGIVIGNSLLADNQIAMRLLDERRRLSAEIHDSFAQIVNLIAFEAGNVSQSYEDGDDELLRCELSRLTDASNHAVKLLRNEMKQLNKDSVDGGLTMDAIKSHVEDFARQWGLGCTVELKGERGDIQISPRISIQLARILNEALVNIVRHACAADIGITIEEIDDSLSITVSDNGCGFDVNAVGPDCMGLNTMRERAYSINGEFNITSKKGSGTKVILAIPHVI